jgi:WhiB family redox-sensing transcriptional regulator
VAAPEVAPALTARDNREYGFWGGENEEERHLAGYELTAPIGVRVRLAREESTAS